MDRGYGPERVVTTAGPTQDSLPARGKTHDALGAGSQFCIYLGLTDVENDRTLFAERLRRSGSSLARAATGDLDLVLEDWSLRREAGDGLTLGAGDAATGIACELELIPTKPIVLHGEGGYSSKGSDPGNASAYVSWTRLATAGWIRIDGEQLDVTGEAWFDHEFGTSVLEEGVVGWDWFGLHLEDGRELMLGGAGSPSGASHRSSGAT